MVNAIRGLIAQHREKCLLTSLLTLAYLAGVVTPQPWSNPEPVTPARVGAPQTAPAVRERPAWSGAMAITGTVDVTVWPTDRVELWERGQLVASGPVRRDGSFLLLWQREPGGGVPYPATLSKSGRTLTTIRFRDGVTQELGTLMPWRQK